MSEKKRTISENWLIIHQMTCQLIVRMERHFDGIKIPADGQRSYSACPHCPDLQLNQNPKDHQLLYSLKVVDTAKTVLDAFGGN
ncbi:hypothetical protein TNCV_892091 [Trichonephila clavipes]|nr:hypothetical protein TNCV_892091 [Trichonephila clavipes]